MVAEEEIKRESFLLCPLCLPYALINLVYLTISNPYF
jgi:hypothetical protein